ncbi:MAG: helix-turn-helix domain-containing protein [Planctomycetes bacterium]|nr:helix-turn-helix domain-containing protein [Planctomycetota bacterium]
MSGRVRRTHGGAGGAGVEQCRLLAWRLTMQVRERTQGDITRLEEMIAAEPRDRRRVVLQALRGSEKNVIAEVLGVAKCTVEQWVHRYPDGGWEGLHTLRRGGARRRARRGAAGPGGEYRNDERVPEDARR